MQLKMARNCQLLILRLQNFGIFKQVHQKFKVEKVTGIQN